MSSEMGRRRLFTSEEEWREAIESAKDELAISYTQGKIDVPAPVDQNLYNLAYLIAKRVITSPHTKAVS